MNFAKFKFILAILTLFVLLTSCSKIKEMANDDSKKETKKEQTKQQQDASKKKAQVNQNEQTGATPKEEEEDEPQGNPPSTGGNPTSVSKTGPMAYHNGKDGYNFKIYKSSDLTDSKTGWSGVTKKGQVYALKSAVDSCKEKASDKVTIQGTFTVNPDNPKKWVWKDVYVDGLYYCYDVDLDTIGEELLWCWNLGKLPYKGRDNEDRAVYHIPHQWVNLEQWVVAK